MTFQLAGNGNQGRVLLCGEVFATAEVRAVLEQMGYQVAGEAADTESAVRAARTLRPDIILIEGDFPPHGGIGTTRRIARENPTAMVIARGGGGLPWVQRAMEAGASGYLTLPLRLDDLAPALLLASSHFNQLRMYERLATEMREANERLLISGLREQQYALQLRKLAELTAELHAAPSLQAMLQTVVKRSCELLDAEIGGIHFRAHSGVARSLSPTEGQPAVVAAELDRLTAAESLKCSEWDTLRIDLGEAGEAFSRGTGCMGRILAVGLRGVEDQLTGALWLAVRQGGDFTGEDEAVLRQIGQSTSLALLTNQSRWGEVASGSVYLLFTRPDQAGERAYLPLNDGKHFQVSYLAGGRIPALHLQPIQERLGSAAERL
jgi:response regulator NasT